VNLSLKQYGGDYAIGAFGIINSIANLIVTIVIGFNQGMQPIVGYNFGAKRIPRMIKAYQMTVFCAMGVSTFGFLIGEIFPGLIASAFTTSQELIDLVVVGMRLDFLMFPVIGFQMVTANFFQSIGKAKISIFLSLTRQILFLIPALLILPPMIGLKGIWLSGPFADLSSSVFTFLVMKWQVKKLSNNHSEMIGIERI
jgi:Na+-driven multidrug efflux pump